MEKLNNIILYYYILYIIIIYMKYIYISISRLLQKINNDMRKIQYSLEHRVWNKLFVFFVKGCPRHYYRAKAIDIAEGMNRCSQVLLGFAVESNAWYTCKSLESTVLYTRSEPTTRGGTKRRRWYLVGILRKEAYGVRAINTVYTSRDDYTVQVSTVPISAL